MKEAKLKKNGKQKKNQKIENTNTQTHLKLHTRRIFTRDLVLFYRKIGMVYYLLLILLFIY